MNEIINVAKQVVGTDSIETVNARELHAKLGSRQDFSDWIKNRIDKFGFTNGEDFTIILGKSTGGRPSSEYHISIDMAKELSMVENNDNGRNMRKWFIAREKTATQLENTGYKLPTTFREALLLAAQQEEVIEQQKLQLTVQAPKVEFFDNVADSTSVYTMLEAANILGGGRNTLLKVLKKQKYLQDNKVPYSQYGINGAGYFTCKSRYVDNTGELSYTTFVTGKGMQYLQKKISWGQLNIKKEK
jgi:anti-repressor protein